MLPQDETIRLPYPIPYCAQVASPELARAIFVEGFDPTLDPRWAETGARDPQEYAYWTERACGVACLKMCVEALGGPVRPLLEWARTGVARGGYRIDQDERGRRDLARFDENLRDVDAELLHPTQDDRPELIVREAAEVARPPPEGGHGRQRGSDRAAGLDTEGR